MVKLNKHLAVIGLVTFMSVVLVACGANGGTTGANQAVLSKNGNPATLVTPTAQNGPTRIETVSSLPLGTYSI
jgi:hypothetical protein